MDKLKRCPFCGNNAEIHNTRFGTKYADTVDHVPAGAEVLRIVSFPNRGGYVEYQQPAFVPRCCDTSCVGRNTKRYESVEDAVRAWNRRKNAGQ